MIESTARILAETSSGTSDRSQIRIKIGNEQQAISDAYNIVPVVRATGKNNARAYRVIFGARTIKPPSVTAVPLPPQPQIKTENT